MKKSISNSVTRINIHADSLLEEIRKATNLIRRERYSAERSGKIDEYSELSNLMLILGDTEVAMKAVLERLANE